LSLAEGMWSALGPI